MRVRAEKKVAPSGANVDVPSSETLEARRFDLLLLIS